MRRKDRPVKLVRDDLAARRAAKRPVRDRTLVSRVPNQRELDRRAAETIDLLERQGLQTFRHRR